ncbi:MAG: M81 family metallopeptidase [Rhodobacteraceae bacterium]|jgi:microcystin degradation protein MlrC|nr:M81 family metallopeptidase [Paracoccaceae bacterium]
MAATGRRQRVAVAALLQESNSFSPIPTTLEVFARNLLLFGDAVEPGLAEAQVELPAMLAVLRGAGIEAVPLMAAHAMAAGPLTRDCFEALAGELAARLAAAGPVDGLLLALHGALVTEHLDDGDGEILARMRALLPDGVPIGASLDLHAHVTPRMLQSGCFLIGYRNYPHTDIAETGARAAALMVEVLAGRRRPVMARAWRPVVVPAVAARTTEGPLAEVAAAARAAEAAGEVLHASIFPVQPWLDVPALGFVALACADGDAAAAERVAGRLADMLWARRDAFDLGLVPLAEAIATGLAADGMTLVSDSGDAPTGGAAADSPAVLRALLDAGADGAPRTCVLGLCDPPAVAAAQAAGVGATVTLEVGHAFGSGSKVVLRGRVAHLSDGRYTATAAGTRGLPVEMGPTAVIAIGSLRLMLRSLPAMEWDPAMYRANGIEPAEAALVFVKSPGHFRATFGPLAARILMADTPGATRADIRGLPYRRVTRPLHPLDPL